MLSPSESEESLNGALSIGTSSIDEVGTGCASCYLFRSSRG